MEAINDFKEYLLYLNKCKRVNESPVRFYKKMNPFYLSYFKEVKEIKDKYDYDYVLYNSLYNEDNMYNTPTLGYIYIKFEGDNIITYWQTIIHDTLKGGKMKFYKIIDNKVERIQPKTTKRIRN